MSGVYAALALSVWLGACPARVGAAPKADEARVAELDRALTREAGRVRTWTFGWGAGYGVLTLGQVAAHPFIIPQDQFEWFFAAGTTAVALAWMLHDQNPVLGFTPRSDDDLCGRIAAGEALLEKSARWEDAFRGWRSHVGNVVVNLAIGLVMGLAYGHWVAGAVNFATGVVFGEATILTAPGQLAGAWSDYLSR